MFYTNYDESVPSLETELNTTIDLALPHGVFGNLYNFSYPGLAKTDYFNNSIFYKIGGDVGFVRDMEIQGFKTYNVDEVQ